MFYLTYVDPFRSPHLKTALETKSHHLFSQKMKKTGEYTIKIKCFLFCPINYILVKSYFKFAFKSK